MIDPLNDHLILLREFAKKLPGEPTYQTVWSWAKYGRQQLGPNGKIIYLETVKMPAGRMTTLNAFYEFIAQLAEDENDKD